MPSNRLFKYALFIMLALQLPGLLYAVPSENNNFLILSDIHLNKNTSHLMAISPASSSLLNNLDESTFKQFLSHITQAMTQGEIKKPSFILLLGDIEAHTRTSKKSIIEDESLVFALLKQYFPTIPIFYVFGNNDSLESDYGPFTDKKNKGLQSPYDIAMQEAGWSNGFLSSGAACNHGIYPCILHENREEGYYSGYIRPKFRLIVLNSVMFSFNRHGMNEQDAIKQRQWFASELEAATKHNESILIALHIPVGNNIYNHESFWTIKDSYEFLKLIDTYHANIVGILSSHTHHEEIKLIKNAEHSIIAGIYGIPALSSMYGNQPAFKIIDYAKEDGRWFLSNYETFAFSMGTLTLTLRKLYDFNTYYCPRNKTTLQACLPYVTAKKLKKYYCTSNPNHPCEMNYPDDMVITHSSPFF